MGLILCWGRKKWVIYSLNLVFPFSQGRGQNLYIIPCMFSTFSLILYQEMKSKVLWMGNWGQETMHPSPSFPLLPESLKWDCFCDLICPDDSTRPTSKARQLVLRSSKVRGNTGYSQWVLMGHTASQRQLDSILEVSLALLNVLFHRSITQKHIHI